MYESINYASFGITEALLFRQAWMNSHPGERPEPAERYRSEAERMLSALSTEAYRSGKRNHSFLLHSTGNMPAGSEIDASIIYADYYYIEALTRLKRLRENGKI